MSDLSVSGTTAGQPVSDTASVSPFAGVSVTTTASATPYATASMALSSTANGALSHLGAGTLSADGATYTVSGSPALVQAALRGLVFTPAAHEVSVGQSVSTGFTITASDTAGTVTDARTTVIATAADTLPTVSQAQAALQAAGSTPGAPQQTASSVAILNSQTTTMQTGTTPGIGVVTNINTFGPNFVGPNTSVATGTVSERDRGHLYVLPGQLEIDVNTVIPTTVSRTVTTTSTDLLSQQYVITGTSAAMPTTTLVSSNASGVEGNGSSYTNSVIEGVTANGTSVLFTSNATNLSPGDTNSTADLFLKNTATGAITLVSTNAAGVRPNADVYYGSVDGDGNQVAFTTTAGNLDARATGGGQHLFIRDVSAGTLTLIAPADYTITNAVTGASEPSTMFTSLTTPAISGDGRYIAVKASNGTNASEVLLLDTVAHTGVDLNSDIYATASQLAVSQDGSTVVLATTSPLQPTGTSPADPDGFADIYAYTRATHSFQLVSETQGVNTADVKGNGASFFPSVSNDGSRVAFESQASNLDDRDTDTTYDVYVKDLNTGRLFLADVTADGSTKGNNGAFNPSISGDGTMVTFESAATNLVPGVTDGRGHIYLKNLTTGAISVVDQTSAGGADDQGATAAIFAPDNAHVAFSSFSTNLVANDTNGQEDVFLTALAGGAPSPTGPVLSGASAQVAYTTGAVPVRLEPNATVTDGSGAITRVYLTVNSTDAGDAIRYDQPASLRNVQPAYTTTGADQGVVYEFDSVSPAGASTADVQAFLQSVRYSSTSGAGARDVRVYLSDATTSHAPVGVTGGTPDALTHLTITPPANPGPPVISGVPAAATYTSGQATAVAPNAVLSDPSGALSSVSVVIDHPTGADTYAYTTPAGLGVVSMRIPSPSGGGSAILIEAQSSDATASLAAFQAFVDSVTFTVPVADGAHAIQVSAYNGNQNATASELLSAGGGGAAVPPAVTGVPATETDPGQATVQPFSTAVVTGTETGQTYTVSLEADRHGTQQAGGTFSGGGFTAAGPDGATFSSTSLAAVQAALRAVSFTPNSADTDVIYNISGSAGNSPVGHLEILAPSAPPPNTPPTISGAQAGQADTAGAAISPFSAVVVTDPDAGQTETVTVSFNAANGTLAGGGFAQTAPGVYSVTAPAGGAGASSAAAQADLRAATFTSTAGQSSTTSFTISVSDGQAPAATDSTTSVVATYTPPATGGGRGGTVTSSPLSVQYGLLTEFQNLERALAGGSDAVTPGTPVYAAFQAEKAIAAQLDTGQLFLGQAETALAHLMDGTTAVAVAAYGFFTGSTPTAAGLNYLVHSPANATDLNDAYYARFSTENRYINFAANLATGPGAGAAAFQANYGSLSLADATAKAYAAVFGASADAAKVSALLDTLVPDGLGGQETRATYFAQYGGDGPNGQGTKAAMIGFLLSNAVHDGSGVYGAATEHYLAALAHGTTPAFGSELALHYGAAVNLVGITPNPDPTITG